MAKTDRKPPETYKLDDEFIRNRERPAKGNVIYYDSEVKGFAVRVTRSPDATFLFCYGPTPRRMVIGKWTASSGGSRSSVVKRMRALAADYRTQVIAGRDPYKERQDDEAEREAARRQREEAEAEREAARIREERDVTVDELFARYLAEHGPKLRPATARAASRRFKRHLRDAWGNRKAKDVTRADVAALVKPLRAQGKASEVVHVLSLVNGLFSFAVDDDELDTITENPARGLKKKLVSKAERPQPKDRALVTAREFRAFYLLTAPRANDQVKGMNADVAACLRLMMLTGCRPSEAAGIEWDEIDFHAKLWNKPADAPGRSKSRRADMVPLVDEAMEILVARRGNGSQYVFPSGRSRRAVNGGGEGVLTEHRLAAALRDAAPRLRRMGVKEPFTPHDLRRTVTTGLFDIDVSEYIIKRTLNHSTKGVTDIHYMKSMLLRQRRAALQGWVDYLEQMIRGAPQADNVVEFRAAAGGR
ncbi:tyrosine-type recombinase/integrase [Luteimonas sp. 50]|uniref:Tyrosine-type recombinase/integrase n=1 Tax=Cognatiluteimonas sedimenti TaxID=2927791 RepID=A0ABT0A4T5_9GAMM|nr:tyrosine-type recombinase/integrase [Lysobacter sedimenti]MCJ0825950.1 tyrosine-type recombinase/integrase [Lysobacter sedimenti]